MYKLANRSWQKHIDFLVLDFIILQFSFVLSYYIRLHEKNPLENTIYREIIFVLAILFFAVVIWDNTYSGILRRNFTHEAIAVFRYNALLFVLTLVYQYIVHNTSDYSRLQMAIFIIINYFLSLLAHTLLKYYLRKRGKDIAGSQRLVLITRDKTIMRRIRQLKENSYAKVYLEGVILLLGEDDALSEKVQEKLKELNVPLIGYSLEDAYEYARTNVVDEVLIDVTGEAAAEMTEVFLEMGITVHLSIDHLAINCPNPTVEKVNGILSITGTVSRITPFQAFLKRLMDILGSIVGLMITGIAFVFVAPIIKKQAPGPVFFSQERVGKNGRLFRIYKFRSMYTDAEARKAELMERNKMQGLMFKMDDDPRIFPFGKTMRNTSIDELPQFWNILKGDMSLVGTRPPTLDEYKQYDLHHKSRLAAKPGLTGLWQVSGRSDITDFEEVVRLDNEYIRNWSLLRDVEIIFRTVKVVFTREGSV